MDPLLALHRVLYDVYFERDVVQGERRVSALRRWHLAQLERRSQAGARGGGLAPLPEVASTDRADVFAHFIRPRRAVVLRSFARDWPAVSSARAWSFETLSQRYGDESIFVGVDDIQRAATSTSFALSVRELKLAAFVDEVARGLPTYIKFVPFIERFPELLEDLRFEQLDALRGNQPLRAPIGHEFYMGGRGSGTDLHTELSEIFHVCLRGRKRWVLYPPEEWPYLYPVPAKTSFVASEVDALNARFETHPLARCARGFEVILEPGDVLYLPPYTWHAVENLEPSISVNHLWHTHLRSLRALPLAYFNCRVLMDKQMGTAEQFLTYFANRTLPSLHAR